MATVNLLLVGRTGNGKSSTGNSILRRKAFTPRSSSSGASDDISKDIAQIDGKDITVVDGPGLGDAGFDDAAGIEASINMARRAMTYFLTGFHALLIVLKYGVRFTKQEKDAIQMIKSVYGVDVVKNYAVIVMTHGESFDLDNEDEDAKTFEDWCREQTGDVQVLFRECSQRVVLVRNKIKDNGKLKEQFENLMSKVDEIRSTCNPYALEDFRKAEPGRTKLTITSRLPKLEKENERVLGKISNEIQQLDNQPHFTSSVRLRELEKLQETLEQHKIDLQHQDQDTGSLSQLLLRVQVTEMSIQSKMKLCQGMIDEEIYQREAQRNRGDHILQMPFDGEKRPLAGIGGEGQIIKGQTALYIKIVCCVAGLVLIYYLFF